MSIESGEGKVEFWKFEGFHWGSTSVFSSAVAGYSFSSLLNRLELNIQNRHCVDCVRNNFLIDSGSCASSGAKRN
jgi:hypothetical protein